ncbi:hypothetical protein LTR78_009008 [Recurvomyces mirabilis]|uniref:Uncharacterized protein n=1 Tax=Recurvomyces mirabilis TaxID=574656 RepID=A0AAE0WHI4_9PEZI|nr:hypothetical protein LTR78_009008 [Recurvomyces mirabilis]KAK5150464.1 hypothetical protein LTS14_010154 [Recurvomyces mirabilis]
MKFSTIFSLAATAAFASAAAIPTPDAALEARQANEAYTIVEALYADIKQYTGAINATASGVSLTSSLADQSAAAASYQSNVEAITAAVNAAKAQTDALSPASKVRRQTDTALAALVENLLLEVSGALNNIIATLGLTSLLGSLNPLVGSLSGLLLSLEAVVDNLLAVVKQLLDGLLTGLSVGLAGLVL